MVKKRKNLYLDFYLPDYNIGIECQGEQHFTPVKFSRTIDENILYENTIERDIIKNKLCSDNNIKILYYTKDYHFNYNFDLIVSQNELLNKILNK